MKLKIMKDLEKRQDINSFICINPIELKQEAIKWIEELQLVVLEPSDKFRQRTTGENPYMTIEWIKHFFNITDKDLR